MSCPLLLLAFLVPTPSIPLDAATRAKLETLAVMAAREGDVVTLREYLRSGFSPEVVTERGDSLLTLAAYHGHVESVALLVTAKGVQLDRRNKMGYTALTAAAYKGHGPIVKLLLAGGATVNASGRDGRTPLMFAALFGRDDVCRMLLKAGADPRAIDADGRTPISLATGQGHDSTVRLLVDALPN